MKKKKTLKSNIKNPKVDDSPQTKELFKRTDEVLGHLNKKNKKHMA